jgi:RNA polymerase sigma factor (sigma-70 family)
VEERRPLADETLMQALVDGQHDALGLLYGRYAAHIAAMARRVLGSADGEDIVQDVFVAVWRHAAGFAPARGTFRHWVRQIARRRILNELRSRRHRPLLCDGPKSHLIVTRLPDDSAGPHERVCRASVGAEIRSAVQQLPAPQREVVAMAFFDELTHAEVADRLTIPLGTAKTRIRAGLRKLQATLAPALVGPADGTAPLNVNRSHVDGQAA